jgi:hypothetical protein
VGNRECCLLEPAVLVSALNFPLVKGALQHATSGYQPQINLAWLSRKIIISRTICMESFKDSPDANRHGGYSIPR